MSKTLKIIVISFIVILILLFAFWRYLFILPLLFHQKVNLPSGIYLPAPSVYQSSEINYDPLHPPLDSNISNLNVDRSKGELVINFQTGEPLTMQLGKAGRVTGCEHQFSMEYFHLPVQELRLGTILVREPILMVSCEMWAWTEKIRPAKLVLREGPFPEGDDFMFGTMCKHEGEICLYFGQAYGTLNATVVDPQSGEWIPDAEIILTNQMGIQHFVGKFTLPLYAGVQMKYKISAPGYPDFLGKISNAFGENVFIEPEMKAGQTSVTGGMFTMPEYGQELAYSFPLGSVEPPTPHPTLTESSLSTSSPTAYSSATPVPR